MPYLFVQPLGDPLRPAFRTGDLPEVRESYGRTDRVDQSPRVQASVHYSQHFWQTC